MQQVLLSVLLLFSVFSTAFAATANILLDREKVSNMSAEEYAAAVQNAPDINARDEYGNTALHFAARYGTPENITALVNAGADVNAHKEDGDTALHAAAEHGTPEKIAALLNGGADVNARNVYGWTALHAAAIKRRPEHITALVNAGADVNARDVDGWTALHFSTAFVGAGPEALETIAALMNGDADVNARSKNGWTALHGAASSGAPEHIIVLLKAGASGSMKDSDGKTPFVLAKENEAVKGTDAYWALNDAQYK